MGHKWRQAMRPRLGLKDHQDSPIRTTHWYRSVLGVYWIGQRGFGRFLDRIIRPSGANPRRTCLQSSIDSDRSELKTVQKRLKNGYVTA
jgi:hypothetical protein